jgi:hypothetical protein
LCILAAVLALLLPNINQDVVAEEDVRFRRFLEDQGYDTSTMGLGSENTSGEVTREEVLSPDKKVFS